MRLIKLAFLMPAILSVNSVEAETYQSFSSINYDKSEIEWTQSDVISLGTQYYFDKRESLGPFNEFAYINTISNVSVYYTATNFDNRLNGTEDETFGAKIEAESYSIRGDWFIGDFLVGASYSFLHFEQTPCSAQCNDDLNGYGMSLGYLVSDDFLIKVHASKAEDSDTFYSFDANYNMQLSNSDYIGFGYNTDEEINFHKVSAKYFMALSSDSYLAVGGDYTVNDFDIDDRVKMEDTWNTNIGYYFNQYSSLSAFYNSFDGYGVGVNHFFNKNYSLSFNYRTNSKAESDFDSYGATFTAQF